MCSAIQRGMSGDGEQCACAHLIPEIVSDDYIHYLLNVIESSDCESITENTAAVLARTLWSPRCLSICWRANFSDTRKVLLPGPLPANRAGLSWPTAEPFCSTRHLGILSLTDRNHIVSLVLEEMDMLIRIIEKDIANAHEVPLPLSMTSLTVLLCSFDSLCSSTPVQCPSSQLLISSSALYHHPHNTNSSRLFARCSIPFRLIDRKQSIFFFTPCSCFRSTPFSTTTCLR